MSYSLISSRVMKFVEEYIVQTAKLELCYVGFTVYLYSHCICTVCFNLCVQVVYLNYIESKCLKIIMVCVELLGIETA